MKKKTLFYFTLLLASLTVFSCQKENTGDLVFDKYHQVNLQGQINDPQVDSDTKGLDLVALPDWRNTSTANIHLYENGVEGENPVMTIDPRNNKLAYFSATFKESGEPQGGDEDEEEDVPIDAPVDGGDEEEEDVPIDAPVANQTKASVYTYNGIIAHRNDSDEYEVPAIQTPDMEVSLIDPNADFLIGCDKVVTSQSSDNLKLEFKRPVSLFRLALINLPKEEKIREIKLTAESAITGKFKRSDVNFINGTAKFDTSEGSDSITLKYDDAKTTTIFFAYFVASPTTTKLLTLQITTDQCVYTKVINSSEIEFSSKVFRSLAIDMSKNVQKSSGEGGNAGEDVEYEDDDLEIV